MTKLLTLREVMQMTALSRSAVYALMGTAQFLPQIGIGRRAVRSVEREVLDFIASRPRGGTTAHQVCAPEQTAWPQRRGHPRGGAIAGRRFLNHPPTVLKRPSAGVSVCSPCCSTGAPFAHCLGHHPHHPAHALYGHKTLTLPDPVDRRKSDTSARFR